MYQSYNFKIKLYNISIVQKDFLKNRSFSSLEQKWRKRKDVTLYRIFHFKNEHLYFRKYIDIFERQVQKFNFYSEIKVTLNGFSYKICLIVYQEHKTVKCVRDLNIYIQAETVCLRLKRLRKPALQIDITEKERQKERKGKKRPFDPSKLSLRTR